MTIPVAIIAHDRLTCLTELIAWFESVGLGEAISIVDNESTYEPLLEYYEKTPHTVYRIENHGPSSPWRVPELEDIFANNYYIVSDPDIYPDDDCPDDIIDVCRAKLDEMPFVDKVGPSLRIDDLPENGARTPNIQNWEGQFWSPSRWMEQYKVWNSPIDTTLAVYRPGVWYKITEAVRLDKPYMFRHLPWYLDFDNLSEEELYYSDHAGDWISTWSRAELPDQYKE